MYQTLITKTLNLCNVILAIIYPDISIFPLYSIAVNFILPQYSFSQRCSNGSLSATRRRRGNNIPTDTETSIHEWVMWCVVWCGVMRCGVLWWYGVWCGVVWRDVMWCDGKGLSVRWGGVVQCSLMLCIIFDLTSCFLLHLSGIQYEPKFILYYSVGLLYSVLLFSIYFHSFFLYFFRSSIWTGIPSEFIKWKITWKYELEISSSWWWKYQFYRRYLRLIIPIYFNVFNSILFHFILFEFISLS